MYLMRFSFSAFTPFIYPPGMVLLAHARQNVRAKKMFSEKSFGARFCGWSRTHEKGWGNAVAQVESKFQKFPSYRALQGLQRITEPGTRGGSCPVSAVRYALYFCGGRCAARARRAYTRCGSRLFQGVHACRFRLFQGTWPCNFRVDHYKWP